MVDEYMLNRSLPRAPLLVAVKMLRPNADDRARSVNSIILFILSKYDRVVKCTLVLFYKVGEQYHNVLFIWSKYDRNVKCTMWCYFASKFNCNSASHSFFIIEELLASSLGFCNVDRLITQKKMDQYTTCIICN